MAKKLTSPQSGRTHATSRVRKADRNLVSGVRQSLTSNLIERSTAAPHQMQPNDVLQLQRLVGNRVVSRMLVQPQLEVGPAGDGYEKEADRIAEQVVRSQSAPPARQKGSQSVQRAPVIQRIS